jgi:hypothetical protein
VIKDRATNEVVHEITLEAVGTLNCGIDGRDQFFLMTSLTDDLPVSLAIDVMKRKFHYECGLPGGYFCDLVLGAQQQYDSRQVILTVQHRYDV